MNVAGYGNTADNLTFDRSSAQDDSSKGCCNVQELLKGEQRCKSERIPVVSLRTLRTVTAGHSVRRSMPTMPIKWLRPHCTTGI